MPSKESHPAAGRDRRHFLPFWVGIESERSGKDLWPGIRAFSQYERGESRQGKALDKLLRLLGRHPDLLDEIHGKVAA